MLTFDQLMRRYVAPIAMVGFVWIMSSEYLDARKYNESCASASEQTQECKRLKSAVGRSNYVPAPGENYSPLAWYWSQVTRSPSSAFTHLCVLVMIGGVFKNLYGAARDRRRPASPGQTPSN